MTDNLGVLARLNRINDDEQAIYDMFGYKGDWRVYPFDNKTSVSWFQDGSTVKWFGGVASEEDIENYKEWGDAEYSAQSIRNTYHCPEQGLTAFVLDTQCDGNIFFTIFKDELKLTLESE